MKELYKTFNNVTDKDSRKKEFTPQIPAQLKANRSILLLCVDNDINEHNEEKIKEEVKHTHEWMTEITQVSKFPK